MDLALTLAEELVIDFVWTDELLTEWERVIVREAQADAGHGNAGIAGADSSLRQGYPATYGGHVDEVPSRDPDAIWAVPK